MSIFSATIGRINRAMATVSGGAFLLISLVITYDVIVRSLGGRALGYADLLSSLAMVLGATASLGYALQVDAHVKVEILTHLMGSQLKRAMTVFSLGLLFLFSVTLTWQAWVLALDSWRMGSFMPQTIFSIKLAVPQLVAAFGYTMFSLQALVATLDFVVSRDPVSEREAA